MEYRNPYGVEILIGVPPRRVNEIVLQKRTLTADTALRLGRCFGTSKQFWLNLQSEYERDAEGSAFM